MKTDKQILCEELGKNEIILINGGDSITRAVFSWFGRVIGSIEAAGNAEAKPGLNSHGVDGSHSWARSGATGSW